MNKWMNKLRIKRSSSIELANFTARLGKLTKNKNNVQQKQFGQHFSVNKWIVRLKRQLIGGNHCVCRVMEMWVNDARLADGRFYTDWRPAQVIRPIDRQLHTPTGCASAPFYDRGRMKSERDETNFFPPFNSTTTAHYLLFHSSICGQWRDHIGEWFVLHDLNINWNFDLPR